MNCNLTKEQGNACLVFDSEADCDTAVAILNADCATCDTDCGREVSVFTSKSQRPDGKWYCFTHPDKTDEIDLVTTNIKEDYTDTKMDITE